MKMILVFILLLFMSSTVYAEMTKTSYTLSEAIGFALKNNPKITKSNKDIEIGTYGIIGAKASKMPHLDFNAGATRYRYASPITPISGSPLKGTGFPEFDSNIYNFGFSFILPL